MTSDAEQPCADFWYSIAVMAMLSLASLLALWASPP